MKKYTAFFDNQKFNITCLQILLLLFCTFSVNSGILGDIDFGGNFRENAITDVNADSMKFVGKNIIAEGNAEVRYQGMQIKADKMIVNISTKDLECIGDVRFIRRNREIQTLSPAELAELKKEKDTAVHVIRNIITPIGERQVQVEIIREAISWRGTRAVGNLSSGAFTFNNFQAKVDIYYCTAKKAERSPDGVISIQDARFSTCEYLMDEQEHYSIFTSKAKLYQKKSIVQTLTDELIGWFGYESSGEKEDISKDTGEYEIIAQNSSFWIGDVPVFWSPILYKPRDEDLHLAQMTAGNSDEYGTFVRLSKKFNVWKDPNINTKLMLDYFSKRGIGYGAEADMTTKKSRTEFFMYGIKDRDKYYSEGGDDDDFDDDLWETRRRIEIPDFRYDIRLSNITHITPRLDFRGRFEKLSDADFLYDYFRDSYNDNPQPASYGSLEYQADRFSAALSLRPRVNDFFTTVERLPEFRVDIPRQELFKNIYYEGETSIAGMKMRWRDYDKPRTAGNGIDPHDYKAARFDSLHMFYYPFKIEWLNVIPRAGIRLTAYSSTSKTKISQRDLEEMFLVDDPDEISGYNALLGNVNWSNGADIRNYDNDGHSKLRVAGEIGLQANTKIYNTWQNVKNAFWELDGLRHMIVPYVNYTYIPEPTVHRNKIYYFDDIDRIERENFIRFGVEQRLQTRRGNYGSEQIYNWASIENYIDYHFDDDKGFKHLGDLGTVFKFQPFPDLHVYSELILDMGQSSGLNDRYIGEEKNHHAHDYRGSPVRDAGRPGIGGTLLNKWYTRVSYDILDDLTVYTAYNYTDNYRKRGTYSMGSSMTEIMSGTGFDRYYGRSQKAEAGIEFPIPLPFEEETNTWGAVEATYDFDQGWIREAEAKLIRRLHCWELALELRHERDRDADGSKRNKNSIMLSMYLTANPDIGIKLK